MCVVNQDEPEVIFANDKVPSGELKGVHDKTPAMGDLIVDEYNRGDTSACCWLAVQNPIAQRSLNAGGHGAYQCSLVESGSCYQEPPPETLPPDFPCYPVHCCMFAC